MTISLDKAAAALGVKQSVPPVPVSGWSIDSRTIQTGDAFFALRGGVRDGHAFVAEAFRKGAAAAIVDRELDTGGTLLRVPDTLRALQNLASWARRRWNGDVVCVTGSGGKTTTKELIARFLETEMKVGKTAGNLNNHIGMPLSILRLPDDARAAVLEIGMNRPGEIRALASIARPTVGVVTNVGRAHLEFFSSIDDVAAAKRELVEALPRDGVAVLNADDPRVIRFRDVHSGPVVTFGFSEEADVRAEEAEYGPDGVRIRLGSTVLESPLLGRHGAYNLLAAVAAARAFGIPPERLREAARTVSPGRMRGQRFTHAGITILDDCYNSNPDALRLMLDVLKATPARRRIAVLGEMLELGRWSESLHREAGNYVAACGINVLIGIRGAACHMVNEAVKAGLSDSAAFFFEDPVEAGICARREAHEGDAVLFKGSRGTQVEKALEQFLK